MNNKSKSLERHPLSGLFSSLDLKGKDLDDLAEDIQAQGLLSPITLHDGMVLDGWNRYQACLMAEVEPVTTGLDPHLNPWSFVWASNGLRRSMTPADKIAIWIRHSEMEGVPNGTPPSVREIQKNLEVGQGTAQRAQQVIKANDPELTEALADKRVSLDRAAEIAKLPKEERQAAIDSPKPKPEPKAQDDSEELARLRSENEDLNGRLSEVSSLMAGLQEELEAARRILDAEDLYAQFQKEVVRAQAQASVVQSRNNGLMNENSDLKKRLKSALRKIEKLEKASQEVAA